MIITSPADKLDVPFSDAGGSSSSEVSHLLSESSVSTSLNSYATTFIATPPAAAGATTMTPPAAAPPPAAAGPPPAIASMNPEIAPPPPFTPYEASFFVDRNKNIISHDPHLNEDGEALYRFLLTKSSVFPRVQIHIHGEHNERCSKNIELEIDENEVEVESQYTKKGKKRRNRRRKHRTKRVVDFDFCISLADYLKHGPFHYSVGDSEPAYRGGMHKEMDSYIFGFRSKISASKQLSKRTSSWTEYRKTNGVAPWIGPPEGWQPGDRPASTDGESHRIDDSMILKSSKSLREWADEYCGSRKLLKEFVYNKVPYGWNFDALGTAIKNTIESTRYEGRYKVSFITTSTSNIIIRPPNLLSRLMSTTWFKVVAWIFLVYPFIWLFKRLHPTLGGGRWEVCGGGYAFKRWIHLDDSFPGQSPVHYIASQKDYGSVRDLRTERMTSTPEGLSQVIGVREGEWFRKWQPTIREYVLTKVQKKEPIYIPADVYAARAGIGLDGYEYPL